MDFAPSAHSKDINAISRVLDKGADRRQGAGARYLEHFAKSNFYFRCTTTYAILRQAGVEIGKRDFIGGL
ncbi:MAG: DUF1993 family protein [Proteobacteria bacterium]|nr:DUF1993 family protein [Pseudomonadota bacterium]